MKHGSIFSDDVAFEDRLILDQDDLAKKIRAAKDLNLTIVLTSGSFDLPHIGHMRYLREARLLGDVLVVGVDSDEKVRSRKGQFRPVIPELERAEMVVHSRYADIVTIKQGGSEQWSLIRTVRPHVLVISERTGYEPEIMEELKKHCDEVVNLPSQAATSTSASIRRLEIGGLKPLLDRVRSIVSEFDKLLSGEQE